MKYKSLLLIYCIVPIVLTGCYDKDEPNDIAYVTAIGIDKTQSDSENFNFTVQFANPTNISGGSSEDGGSGKDIMNDVSVEAPNIYSAVGLVNDVISKKLNLSHMKLFVFSKEVAQSGIKSFLETISRSEEIRPNVYTAVSEGEANKYLKNTKPIVEISPAKYYQLIYEKGENSAVPSGYNQDLYFYTSVAEKNSVIPLTGIAGEESGGGKSGGSGGESGGSGGSGGGSGGESGESGGESGGGSGGGSSGGSGGDSSGSGESDKKNEKQNSAPINSQPYQYNIRDYKAGQVAMYQDKKGEAVGGAVFKKDKMVGELGFIEVLSYNMLTNNFTRNYVTVKSEKSDTPVTLLIDTEDRTKIKYDRKEHKATVKLTLAGDFVSLPDDYLTEHDLQDFEKSVEGAITEEMNKFVSKTQTEFDSDIVGFGMYAKKTFFTSKEFDDFDWEGQFKNMKFEIKTVFKVRRTGLTSRTETK